MSNISKYNEFINQIKEGLLETYPLKTSIKLISRYLSLDKSIFKIDSDDQTNTIFIKIVSETMNKDIVILLRNINLCGYFISNYDFYNKNDDHIDYLIHKDIINDNFIKSLIKKINESYYTQITIEAKFNTIINIPKKLYHVTLSSNQNKVNKIGLVAKSKNKKANHNGRIYFGYNPIITKNLAYQFGKGKYILLEIDTSNIDIKLYDDPDFTGNGAYTYNNIKPSIIKIIDEFTI